MAVLELVPISFRVACDYVAKHHRHHRPPQGMKFCIGVRMTGSEDLNGVVIVGRPVSRHEDDGFTAEVIRSCTDGTRNTNSKLYGAARRAARGMGYRRIITYTQDGESGASLRADGWRAVKQLSAQPGWSRPGRPRTGPDTGGVARTRWEAQLAA